MQNQNIFKKIIITLIILVVGVGVYFGVTFYQTSKKALVSTNNTNPNRTPFQTRTSTGTDVTIIENTPKKTEVTNPTNTVTEPTEPPRLLQLWKDPVSGFDFVFKDIESFSTSTATNTVSKKTILKNQAYIYFWDRSTGNIYENLASTTKPARISNQVFPRAEEVYFTSPTTAFIRELNQNNENIITSQVTLFKETATSTLFSTTKKSISLIADLVSVSKETKKVFYFLKGTGQGFVSNTDLSSVLKVLETEIKEWIPQYVNKTTLAATTKPSAYFKGYLFFINSTGTQDNQYILGDKYGFTTLVSPDGTKVLYNEIDKNLLETSIYDIKTKTTIRLTQATLVEKCTWSNDSKKIYCSIPQKLSLAPYPDVWYQGSTSFSDNIWSINPKTGDFEIEIALQDQVIQPIDGYNLKTSSDNKYILFQDKYTLSLWKYTF